MKPFSCFCNEIVGIHFQRKHVAIYWKRLNGNDVDNPVQLDKFQMCALSRMFVQMLLYLHLFVCIDNALRLKKVNERCMHTARTRLKVPSRQIGKLSFLLFWYELRHIMASKCAINIYQQKVENTRGRRKSTICIVLIFNLNMILSYCCCCCGVAISFRKRAENMQIGAFHFFAPLPHPLDQNRIGAFVI